ncbi:twin-arginine translocation signal domain-containing protein, partial [Oceanospirillum sp. HFRX-1_2]
MKLTKKTATGAGKTDSKGLGLSRRTFLKNTGITTGGLAAAGFMGNGMIRKAEAKTEAISPNAPKEVKRTICSHCSVGCGVYAEVQ